MPKKKEKYYEKEVDNVLVNLLKPLEPARLHS